MPVPLEEIRFQQQEFYLPELAFGGSVHQLLDYHLSLTDLLHPAVLSNFDQGLQLAPDDRGKAFGSFTVGKNKNYGVWLRGASNNQINCSNTDKNDNIGVYVGCSVNGPINGKCSPKVPPSKNNLIYDHSAENNTNFGVVIDLGNTGNIVTDLFTSGNGTLDLLDENPNCDNNFWFFNSAPHRRDASTESGD